MKKQEIFESKTFKSYYKRLQNKLYPDQKEALEFLSKNDKATIFQPTGTGKSLIIYSDLIRTFKEPSIDICAIASHRLMLNEQHTIDLFKQYETIIGHIGFVFVGSSRICLDKFRTKQNNKKLKELGLNYGDIINFTISEKEVNSIVDKHIKENRDVVIISTYHSLFKMKNIHLNTIYCDEAHLLASEMNSSEFRRNFECLDFEKSYFFTATPRDAISEETDSFLMNNENIFGERHGLTFKDSVERGYIIKPIMHIATPSNYEDGKDFGKSGENLLKFVTEVYDAHKTWLKENSAEPDNIEPKLLIKCASVDHIWDLHERALDYFELLDVNVLAGASRHDRGELHYFNDEGIKDRGEFLGKMKDMESDEGAIILHYDILSEGINVPGITGVLFLNDILPTKSKIVQNTGRSTRKHDLDSLRLRSGEIDTDDYSLWIKPYCAVIVPVMDIQSIQTKNVISKTIKDMRDDYGYDPAFYVSEGKDISKSKEDEGLPGLNKKNRKPKSEYIEDILNEIEKLDKLEQESSERMEFREKLDDCQSLDDAINLL